MKKASAPHLADWNLLRSFLAIYETGTLTQAAKQLGATQPNMGRHLRELEAQIGETLFVRRPGKLEASERARALYLAVAPMAMSIRDAALVFAGSDGDVAGVVRIAVSEVFACSVVAPILAPLLHEQPELEIELSVSNLADNLLKRDADIAVRFFRPDQDNVIARKVGVVEFGLFAHEDYIAKFGEPKDSEMSKHGFLAGFDKDQIPIGPSLHGEPLKGPIRFRYRSDSSLARQAVVECGGGVGTFQINLAEKNTKLHRVLKDRVHLVQEIWLCAHDELRRSSRMRFVWDRLGAGLEEVLRPKP